MSQLLPPKKEVALALLERSNVDVYLDPRAKGVVVPPQFRKEPRLILKIGLNMPVPIPDLRLDEESMSCTLSFSRTPFFCVVPWDSVFAMVGDDGRGMVWPDDVPQELAVRVVEDPQEKPAPSERADRDRDSAPVTPRRRGKAPAVVGPAGDVPDGPRAVPDVGAGDRPARGKRGKKKKEERPVLVAVPPTEKRAPAPASIEASRERRERGEAAPPPPPVRPQGPPSQRPPASRPKRELPPYLRVVK